MPRKGTSHQPLPELALFLWNLFRVAISIPIVWMVIQYYRGH